MKPHANKRLSGILIPSLALWIALLPLISAVHMALVPHVYSAEHRHFHEVVTTGQAGPVEDTAPGTASYTSGSPASQLSSLEECPLCNLALRQGAVFSLGTFPEPVDRPVQSFLRFSSIHLSWPVIFRAPKHSPPLHTA